MPYIFNEDQAIKEKLKGIKVADTNAPIGGRPVAVRFRLPETELADVTFPLIVIEHRNISRAEEREHRGGLRPLGYSPDGFAPMSDPTDPTTSPHVRQWPIPQNIDYMVRVFARNIQHMIYLTAVMQGEDLLHPRFAYLDIPQDGTVRRLDIIGGPTPADVIDTENKRYFQRIWIIRVSTELLPSQIYEFNSLVNQIDVNLDYYSDTYDVPVDIPIDQFKVVA